MTSFRLFAGAWIVSAALASGIFNADFRCSYPSLYEDAANARQTFGASIAFGAIAGPGSLALAYLLSGFAYYGVSWSLGPIDLERECLE